MQSQNKIRCAWAESDKIMIDYHDAEWGVPSHDERHLFEMMNLEGAQAGLSWSTILKRRDNYRLAFDYFDPSVVARYDDMKKASLLVDEGIIRNQLKIRAVVENAKAYLKLRREVGNFSEYLWSFVENTPLTDSLNQQGKEKSEDMSRELKKCGFKFVGPTICYAFMQAVGMINDHEVECFRRTKV